MSMSLVEWIVPAFGIVIVVSQYVYLHRLLMCIHGFSTFHRTVLSIVCIHLGIALSTQFFGIFSYQVILGLHILVVLVLRYIVRTHKNSGISTIPERTPFEWGAMVLLVTVLFSLSAVYVNYRGVYNTSVSNEYFQTRHVQYPYPSVSDEWYAIAWMKDVVQTGTLPLRNPLDPHNASYFNLQFPFHALLASTFVLFGADPLTHYVIFSVLCNSLLVLLLYQCMRFFGASQESALVAAVASLSIPWGATLLGLWSLIPATFGSILLLIFILESSEYLDTRSSLSVLVMNVVVIGLLYPPYLVFVLPVGLVLFVHSSFSRLHTIRILLGSAVLTSSVVLLLLMNNTTDGIFGYLWQRVWYQSLLGSVQPVLVPHQLMCMGFFLFAVGAVVSYSKVRSVAVTVWCTGLLLWMVYAMTTWRLIIGYERVVVITLFVTLILASVGYMKFLEMVRGGMQRNIIRTTQVMAVLFALTIAIFYTQNDSWKKLVAVDTEAQHVYLPGAPIILAYHEDDALLFEDMQGAYVLSTPWKGTVLGVVADVIPVTTQPGTISLNPGLYGQFMSLSCEHKYTFAVSLGIDYTYTHPFECPHFIDIASSKEGLQVKYLE